MVLRSQSPNLFVATNADKPSQLDSIMVLTDSANPTNINHSEMNHLKDINPILLLVEFFGPCVSIEIMDVKSLPVLHMDS